MRPYEPAAESPDREYPFWLNTGRVLEHWHTGSMTRRTKVLNELKPHAEVEINTADAARLNIKNGEKVKVSTRRGSIEIMAQVSDRVMKNVIFIPFHFMEASANMLTNDALDPIAKIPEYKVCSVKVEKIGKCCC